MVNQHHIGQVGSKRQSPKDDFLARMTYLRNKIQASNNIKTTLKVNSKTPLNE